MTRCCLLSVAIFCLLQTSRVGIAQPGGKWEFRNWQSRDGLPENTVQAIAQTEDGFLWVGTSGGLARFDGESFEIFNHRNTATFQESNITCLLVAHDKSLWIGTDGGGLIRRQQKEFANYTTKQGLENLFVRTLFEDHEGTIWIGTANGLFRRRGTAEGRFEKVLDGISIQTIGQGAKGQLLLGGARLYTWDHERLRPEILGGQLTDANVRSILRGSDGTVWVGWRSGLSRRRSDQHNFESIGGIRSPVTSLSEARDGRVIIGTSGDGVYQWQNGRLTHLDASTSASKSSVFTVFEDRDRSVWIGTQAGLLQMMESPVQIVHLPEHSSSDFGTVYLDRGGTLWVASKRLFKVRNGVATPFSLRELKGSYVLNVIRDHANTLWLGTNGNGVFHVTPQGVMHYTVADGLANNFIRILTEGHDRSIWIGTDAGVSHLVDGKFHNYGVRDGLCNPTIQAIVEDSKSTVWIGTARGLSHLDINHDRFLEDTATRGLQAEKVWSTFLADGILWIGTRSGGLYGYEHGALMHYTAADGLGTDSIYKVVADRSGHIWLSGPLGILTVTVQELKAHTIDPSKEISPQFYYISDRHETVQFYGGIQSGGVVGPAGDVWFPSDHGPVHIIPNQRQAPAQRLRITSAVADGKPAWEDGAIRLAPDSANLEIQYAPILLTPQTGMHYKYMLEGLDKEWTRALRRKTAYFTQIPAGTYKFRVRGYDAGHPSEFMEATVNIVKLPHFYRTWWFVSAMVIFCGLAVWLIHFLNTRKVNARFRLVLEERTRLAREMHDTVLQGCASVSSLLEASSSSEADPDLRHALMDYARSQIAATMDEARRAVWNLRKEGNFGANIATGIAEMVNRLSLEFSQKIECQIAEDVPLVDNGMLHEILMVTREALYNSLTHANADRILITIKHDDRRVTFSICDDGNGFDATQPAADGHYGLTGMQERVHRMGGEFHVTSAQHKGTSAVFSIPANALEAGSSNG